MGMYKGIDVVSSGRALVRVSGSMVDYGSALISVDGKDFPITKDQSDDKYVAYWFNIVIYFTERFLGESISEEIPAQVFSFLFKDGCELDLKTLECDVVRAFSIIRAAVHKRIQELEDPSSVEESKTYFEISSTPIIEDSTPNEHIPSQGIRTSRTLYKFTDGSSFRSEHISVRNPCTLDPLENPAINTTNHLNDLRRLVETFCICSTIQMRHIGKHSATRCKTHVWSD